MLKIVNIVGVRPQFIKYFPVSRAIGRFNRTSSNRLKDVLIHTGQHYDYNTSKIFFDELGIREPDYHLEVGSGTHGKQTGLILQRSEKVLLKERPDIVLVYGDTNSTLGGALAAAKLHIPVAHVEAGLRSFNRKMPEELNRIMTDHISSLLFCPSKTAIHNLSKEGFTNIFSKGKLVKDISRSFKPARFPSVYNVGDVMHDVIISAIKIAEYKSNILKTLRMVGKDYYLLTLHRAENTDDPGSLQRIIDFVNRLSANKSVIFPMHPRTKKVCISAKKRFRSNVKIIEPVGYFESLILLKNSELIMTDSGGMQKEAYWLKIPCITLREETEWIETIESGWNVLYRDYTGGFKPSQKGRHSYGDGKASEKIIKIIFEAMNRSAR